jgi:hypothetical protein
MIVHRLPPPRGSFIFEGHPFTWSLEDAHLGQAVVVPARMGLSYAVGASQLLLAMGEKGLYIYLNHRLVYGVGYEDDTSEIAQTAFAARGLQAMVELGLRAWESENRKRLS